MGPLRYTRYTIIINAGISGLMFEVTTSKVSAFLTTYTWKCDRGINRKCLFAAKSPDLPLHIVYVPSHLYHMLFELFKVRHYKI